MDDWVERHMEICRAITDKSDCLHEKNSVVVIKNDTMLLGVPNGRLTGVLSCNMPGQECMKDKYHHTDLCRGSDAISRLFVKASRQGITLDGVTIFTTTTPTQANIKMVAEAGVKRIVYDGDELDFCAMEVADLSDLKVTRV